MTNTSDSSSKKMTNTSDSSSKKMTNTSGSSSKKMTNTSDSSSISLNSILIWLSIFIIGGLVIFLMVSKYTKDSDDGVPMGTIIAAVFKDPPKGYIKCDGSTIDQNLYPKLAGLLQSESAPDLTHKFLRGIDNEQVLSSKEQSTAVNGLKIEPADHTHDYKSYKDGGSGQPGSGDFVASQAGGYSNEIGINYVYANDGSTTSPVQVQSLAINSSDDETAPEHVFVYFFIKAE